MFILGLLLIVVGALAIVGAFSTAQGSAGFLGFDDVSALAIFLVGLGSGLAILWGLMILKFGTKRSLQQRREQKRLTELSDQLDQVEARRRNDDDEDRPSI